MKKILLGLFILLSATVFGQNIHTMANTSSTVYYAEQYPGIKNDSSTDCTTGFRNLLALMAANGGGKLKLGTGKGYIVSDSLLINFPIEIEGDGSSSWNVGPIAYSPKKGATNFYFTSGTKNFICLHNSSTNQGPKMILHNFSIINTSGTTPTAGAGIVLQDDIQNPYISTVNVTGFYTNIWIVASNWPAIYNCDVIAPVFAGIIIDNNIQVDYGGGVITHSRIISGNISSSTAVGILIHGGGGIIVADNFFNAQVTYGASKNFYYCVQTDFTSGLTSDFKFHHNFYENFQISAHYWRNVNATKLLTLSFDGEEIGPYNSTGAAAYDIKGFSQINISNIQAIASPSVSYPVIKIDSSVYVTIGPNTYTGYTQAASITNTIYISPYVDNYNLVYPTTHAAGYSGSDVNIQSYSTTSGYGQLLIQPVTTTSAMTAIFSPKGTVSGTQVEVDFAGADKTTGNFPYLGIGANGSNVYFTSQKVGSPSILPMQFSVGTYNWNFTTSGTTSLPGDITSVGNIISTGAGTFSGALKSTLLTVTAGDIQMWKDATPTYAANVGMNKPGNATSNNMVLSLYNGSTWTDYWTLFQTGNLVSGSAPTDNATAKLQVVSTTAQIAAHYDATHYTTFTTNSSGYLTITPSGSGATTYFSGPVDPVTTNASSLGSTSFVWNTAYINSTIPSRRTVADAAINVNTNDYLIAYTSITASRAVTLQSAASVTGQYFIIKDESGSASVTNTITIVGTVEGASNPTAVNSAYGVYRIYSNGTTYLKW